VVKGRHGAPGLGQQIAASGMTMCIDNHFNHLLA
jgi:hypothetical protein